MKNPFRTRYRIMRDNYCGYEAQYRWWWCPVYFQLNWVNTNISVEQAERLIATKGVVKQIQ